VTHPHPSSLRMIAFLMAVAFIGGCGGNGGRSKISGTVQVDGKPLKSGIVSFQPAPGNPAPSAGCPVAEGRFEIPASAGLMPGNYLVRVEAFRETGKKIRDPQRGLVPEIVPLTFRERLPLEAKVTAMKNNQFEFNLTARSP
jgi:hypothetical protein